MNPPRIAVTGLFRGDNPQPGSPIISSIRRAWPEAFIVGLVYDVYESGIYAPDGPDVCYAMPYPTAGPTLYLRRLEEVRARTPFDLFLPSLDAEIVMLAGQLAALGAMGLRCALPEPALLARCSKAKLAELAAACEVPVPQTAVARDLKEAVQQAQALGYPLFVKGQFYDAIQVESRPAMVAAATNILADWGPPVLLQEPLRGPEFNVLGIGDGQGGLLGHCAVRKMLVSEKGKGNGSVIVRDPRLDEITRRLIAETRWLGPFELEFLRSQADDAYHLIEINPRFPAWVDFPAQLGANFAAAWVRWLAGAPPRPVPDLTPGMFFIRHQVEVCGDMARLSSLLDHPSWDAQPPARSPSIPS